MDASGCPSASAALAWYTADWPHCTSSSMLAHLCLMAWKEPIGRPNCSRTLAYSTESSSQRAERQVADPRQPRHGVPAGADADGWRAAQDDRGKLARHVQRVELRSLD